jgi:HlyD family secretion protein
MPVNLCAAHMEGRALMQSATFDRMPCSSSRVKTNLRLGELGPIVILMLLMAGCSDRNEPGRATVSGTIETDEVRVASRYGGRVAKVHGQEGDSLKAGQVIVELEATELQARREYAVAFLAELQEGPRKEEIAAAKSDWESLSAELKFVRADDKRARELFEQKAISESQRDRAVSSARALEESVAAARARYDLLLAGSRPERIAQAKALLAEIDAQLREMKIVVPGDSVLEVLHVKVGDVLAPNREVATLLLPQHLWVRVYVPEPWLGHLKAGQQVRARVDSFPNKDFKGVIEQINRAAEFTPRNVQTVEERIKQVFGIKVRLANEEDQLRAGMSADISFPQIPGQATPTK